MRSVDISKFRIAPLSKNDIAKGSLCSQDRCKGRSAKWTINASNSCSECFLYELLQEQPDQLSNLIIEIEKMIGYSLQTDEGVISGEGADRVVSGLVLTDRIEKLRGKSLG